MNYLDIIILSVVIFFFIKGLFRGFFQEVFGLVGIVVALILATKYMSDLAAWLDNWVSIPPAFTTLLGFLLIFFCIIFLSHLTAHLLQRIFKYSFLGWLEKIGGGVVGFLKGATIISLLILFSSKLPYIERLIPGTKESILYEPTQRFAPKIYNFIMEIIPDSKSFDTELKESFENFSSQELIKNTQDLLNTVPRNEKPPKNQSEPDDKSH